MVPAESFGQNKDQIQIKNFIPQTDFIFIILCKSSFRIYGLFVCALH